MTAAGSPTYCGWRMAEAGGFRSRLVVPASGVRESFEVTTDAGLPVLVSSEPVAAGTTTQSYAAAYAALLPNELPGYRELAIADTVLFGDRPAFVRRFSWAPGESTTADQVVAYCVVDGRGYHVSRAATTADDSGLDDPFPMLALASCAQATAGSQETLDLLVASERLASAAEAIADADRLTAVQRPDGSGVIVHDGGRDVVVVSVNSARAFALQVVDGSTSHPVADIDDLAGAQVVVLQRDGTSVVGEHVQLPDALPPGKTWLDLVTSIGRGD